MQRAEKYMVISKTFPKVSPNSRTWKSTSHYLRRAIEEERRNKGTKASKLSETNAAALLTGE